MTISPYSTITSQPGGPYIRLLHLRPGTDKDAPIEAKLDIVPLHHEHSNFEALSYFWGQELDRDGLKLQYAIPGDNGSTEAEIGITANLAVALRHLRYPDRTRILWVDAVCINQNHIIEKTSQVSIMNRIYRRAQRVLIWMGPARDRSDWVFAHLNKVYDEERAMRDEKKNNTAEGSGTPATTQALLTQMLNREWYTRVWIVQELCVAKEALVMCGDSSAPWDAIQTAFKTLDGSSDAWQPSSLLNYRITRHRALERLHFLTAAGQYVGLDEALTRCRWFRATCPLDKVYALLGISTRDPGISPDYAASPETAFERVTQAMLLRSTVPDLLDFVVSPASVRRNPSLPSWVPDWGPGNVSAQTEVAQTVADAYHLERLLRASDNSNAHDPPLGEFRPRFHRDSPTALIVQAVETDTIAALSEPIPGPWLGNAYTTEANMEPFAPKENPTPTENLGLLKANWDHFLHNLIYVGTVVRKQVDYAPTMVHVSELVTFARRQLSPVQNRVDDLTSEEQVTGRTMPVELSNLLASNARALDTITPPDRLRQEAEHAFDPVLSMTCAILAPRLYRRLYLHKLLPPVIYHGLIWLTGIFGVFVKRDRTYAQAIGALNILTPWIGMRVAVMDRGAAVGERTRFLCLVPHTATQGDTLVLIAGGRHPYVVRPRLQEVEVDSQARWMLIGPCYLSIEDMALLRESWNGQAATDMFFS
ncbi:heterokaryon incompatibility protein-domain-containing protein [Rhypophila decipiens]|uniref:Heterokaryon incompatibility protein-domain-containing protein n=1 Tax=Rhypophila decipiens TaxID=261697 RepID=A0AAN6Y904_9PEZI|nr:heterokaryon incompatibility protein-domain-containing protein [Rhypophila decipiens]